MPSSAWLEESLDAAARAAPNPGAPALHRLNRAEYANAVRDLLDVTVDATTLLPGDDSSAGFDNIASALSVSPALLRATSRAAAHDQPARRRRPERELGASRPTARRAAWQSGSIWTASRSARAAACKSSTSSRSMPSTRSASAAPAGSASRRSAATRSRDHRQRRARRSAPGAGPRNARVARSRSRPARKRSASRSSASATRRASTICSPCTRRAAASRASRSVGPRSAIGVGDTPSRRRLFSLLAGRRRRGSRVRGRHPRRLADARVSPAHGRRRTALATLLAFYAAGRAEGSFDAGIQRAVARVLVDPEFIFRFEAEPAELPAGIVYRVSDVELASRLSFFLWSSIPDEPLLAAAAAGELAQAGGARARGPAHARGPEGRRARRELRGAVARFAPARHREPDEQRVRRQLAAGLPQGNRAVVRERAARGSQRRGPADGRLHVRRRAPRTALRHTEHPRQPFSPHRARGRRRAAGCSATAAS